MKIVSHTEAIALFREFVLPHLPTKGLEGLDAVMQPTFGKKEQLLQGATAKWSFESRYEIPTKARITGACVIGYCGWKSGQCKYVAEVHRFVDRIAQLHRRQVIRFMDWADSVSRADLETHLLPVVEAAIADRSVNGYRAGELNGKPHEVDAPAVT